MSESDELLDIVDKNDTVISTVRRRDLPTLLRSGTGYIRCVEAFLRRDNGDIWVPRRSAQKTIAPGGLDFSIAGHVLSGESYTSAVIREASEETGVPIDSSNIQEITYFSPSASTPFFRTLYIINNNKQPVLSAEHTDGKWIPLYSMRSTLDSDIPTKETLAESIDSLIQYTEKEKRQ